MSERPTALKLHYATDPQAVAAAVQRVLGATLDVADSEAPATMLRAELPDITEELSIRIEGDESSTEVTLTAPAPHRVPYFWWFLGFAVNAAQRRALRHAAAVLTAEVEGRPLPKAPRRRSLTPPVPFTRDQVVATGTISAAATVAGFGAALFGSNVDFIADSFDASNRALGVSLAVTRAGLLVTFVAAALADRQGRRRLLLASVTGVCVASAVSAVAPTLAIFTVAQLLVRGFVNATLTVAAIAIIEEAPEKARAYSVAMTTLAAGAGFGISVALLPTADLGPEAWRISFAVCGACALAVPGFARRLRETHRYSDVVASAAPRGRMNTLTDRAYSGRFLLLAATALLVNVFNAPGSQFFNRFLADERGFSGVETSVFRTVTSLLPGIAGIVLGGRLAESRGRRPVASVALLVATAAAMLFFVGDGLTLWLTAPITTVFGALAAPSLVAFGPELFPTEVRGTANAAIVVAALLGSIAGLVLAGYLADTTGTLGEAIAWLGLAQLIAAIACVPRLPEPAGRELEDISRAHG